MSLWDWLFQRRRREEELDEEVQSHLRMAVQERMEQGEAAKQARASAIREFGNVTLVKEVTRDIWEFRWLEELLQDLRYGLRMLGKSRGLTAILALTLALGIGVNTAIFSVLNGWLFRPLPVRAPEQIMVLGFFQQEVGSQFSYLDFLDFQKQADTFSDLFGYATGGAGFSVNGSNASEFAYCAVSGNYFSALGLKPALGRLFGPGEGEKPGEEGLVVLGYSFWQTRFGGDSGIVGKQVQINGKPVTVIGVAPREFHGTFFAFDMDGYLSLNAAALVQESSGFWTDRRNRLLMVLGRLKPGASRRQAQGSVDVIAGRLAAQYPATNKEVKVRVIPERLARPAPFVTSFVPAIASLFLVLPGLVLLLASMNVANILLARAAVRRREMAIRVSLGAGRGRLIRQLLTESLLLAFLGALGGLVLGKWAIGASGSMLHSVTTTTSNIGFRLDTSLDWRVFAYALGIALLTGILVGVWPAFRASRADVNTGLSEGGRGDSAGVGRHGIRNMLVVAQVAGSLILLIVAGLFVRSLEHAEHMDLGFDPDHVVGVMLDVRQVGYDQTRAKTFFQELQERTQSMPGVQTASLALTAPLGMPSPRNPIYVEGRPLPAGQLPPKISHSSIDPAYFETLRIPLLSGRPFADSDNETARPVAIVNQAMAASFWPNQDPIGKRFSLNSDAGPFVEVVGLARDGQSMWMLSFQPQPFFYMPLAQNYAPFLTLLVRTKGPPESLIPGVEQEIRQLAPGLPILNVATMQQAVHGLAGLFIFRLAASLAGVMGILGLTLAVVGVYGMVSYSVSQRTREIGIRMALGAERMDVLKLTLGQGLVLVITGVVAGLVVAWALTRAMSRLLIGVSHNDPTTYAMISILLLAVALAACYLPARRATKVDPMVALRYE
jgi:predicted permease